jgi:hypothetical protein
MEDTDILYTNNHVVTYVPDFQTKPSVSKPSRKVYRVGLKMVAVEEI